MQKKPDQLPVFKTHQESSYEEFKKRYKMFILWSCLQWGALLSQSLLHFIHSHLEASAARREVVISSVYLFTWILYIFLLHRSSRSYKWYQCFDFSSIFGILVICGTNLWRGSSLNFAHASLGSITDFSQRFAEVTFNTSCFLFLTRKLKIRLICFIIYALSNVGNAHFTDSEKNWYDIVHSLTFYSLSLCAFGVLSYTVYEGHRRQLEEQKEFWRLSFEMIPHAIAIFDSDSSLVYHNQSLAAMLQHLDESEGLNVSQMQLSERVCQLNVQLRAKAGSRRQSVHTLTNVNVRETYDSSVKFNEFLSQHAKHRETLVPVFADCVIGARSIEIKAQKTHFKGHGDFFMVIFVDVTYRNKIAQLEDQNGFKDLLFKSVSHELRGPLNGSMMGISSLLKHDLPQDCKEVLSTSLVCQRRLLKSIDGILDLAKINSMQFTPVLRMFDLRELIQGSMSLFAEIIKKKSINIKVEIFEGHSAPVTIHSDPERIEQILYQVIDNAIKFTTPHGNVSFTAKLLPPTSAQEVGKEDNEDLVEIILEDSGCGMSQAEINKISSLSETGLSRSRVSENSTGASLGLSIVTHLLKRVGSGFKIQSEVSSGTKVSFRLKNFSESTPLDFENNWLPLADSPTLIEIHKRPLEADSSSCPFEFEREELGSLKDKPRLFPTRQSINIFKTNENIEGISPLLKRLNTTENSRQSMKVLIVDDDAFNIFALESALNQMGREVLVAYNGKEAIEVLQKHHSSVEVVFMDLNMPVMNGYSATKELKKLMKMNVISSIQIIACTAYAQENERKACLEMGFDDFLTKPLNLEKLKEILRDRE